MDKRIAKLAEKYAKPYVARFGNDVGSTMEQTFSRVQKEIIDNFDTLIITTKQNGAGQYNNGVIKSNTYSMNVLTHEMRHAQTTGKADTTALNLVLDGDEGTRFESNVIDEPATEFISSQMLGKAPNAYLSGIPLVVIFDEFMEGTDIRLEQERSSQEGIRKLFPNQNWEDVVRDLDSISCSIDSNNYHSFGAVKERLDTLFSEQISQASDLEQAQKLADKLNNVDDFIHKYNVRKNNGYLMVIRNAKKALKEKFPQVKLTKHSKREVLLTAIKDNLRYATEYTPKFAQKSRLLTGVVQGAKVLLAPITGLAILGGAVRDSMSVANTIVNNDNDITLVDYLKTAVSDRVKSPQKAEQIAIKQPTLTRELVSFSQDITAKVASHTALQQSAIDTNISCIAKANAADKAANSLSNIHQAPQIQQQRIGG